jgi:NitT/TauT family transport system substrate-binding protein
MSDRRTVTDRRTLLKAFAVTPLLLAGCASQGGSGTASGTLSIGQISNSVAFFPLFVAEERGHFTAEDLQLGDRPRLGTGAKLAAALQSSSIDIGAGVVTDALNLAETNTGTRLVTSLVTEYYVDIVVGPTFAQPATLPDKIQALVGKNIGITGPGSGTEALVDHLFTSVGRDAATDATLVNLGGDGQAALGALSEGRVDALSFFQPVAQQAEATGVGTAYISPARGDVPSLDGVLHGVVFSTQELLDGKQEELAAFKRAMTKAHADIHGDPALTRDLLGKYMENANPAAVDALAAIVPQEIPQDIEVQRAAYESARKFHLESGLVDSAPTYEEIVLSPQPAT